MDLFHFCLQIVNNKKWCQSLDLDTSAIRRVRKMFFVVVVWKLFPALCRRNMYTGRRAGAMDKVLQSPLDSALVWQRSLKSPFPTSGDVLVVQKGFKEMIAIRSFNVEIVFASTLFFSSYRLTRQCENKILKHACPVNYKAINKVV